MQQITKLGLLSAGILLSSLSAATSHFESPIAFSASKILPPNIVSGPNHTVRNTVGNDGFLNIYNIDSKYGPIRAVSTATLFKRIGELNAMAGMEEFERSEEFRKSLGEKAGDFVEGGAMLLKDPLGSVGFLLRARVSVPSDGVSEDDDAVVLVRRAGPAPVIVVGGSEASPIARSLTAGGVVVQRVAPSSLRDALRSPPSLVVLDDVHSAAVSAAGVRALEAAVRAGTGLLVLAGPSSFGAGAYRGSRLEDLLPVEVAAPSPEGSIALQFLIDTSGSMARTANGRRRIDAARRAVLDIASGLGPEDRIGVQAFDVASRDVVTGSQRVDVARLEALLARGASGGTRLAPALRGGLEALAEMPAADRVLVVVTDGRVERDLAVSALTDALRRANVELLLVIVGEVPPAPGLQQLVERSEGRLLRLSAEEVPRIVRAEIDRRRFPVPSAPATPRRTGSAPVLADVRDWPSVSAFAVTRARDGADVVLSVTGDLPLLAHQRLGAGRVAVLTSGLDRWAARWIAWPRFGELTGDLLRWLAPRWRGDALQLRLNAQGRMLHIRADRVDARSRWAGSEVVRADFEPELAPLALTRTAPGRVEGWREVTMPGRYRVSVDIDGETAQGSVVVPSHPRMTGPRSSVLETLAQQGVIQRLNRVEALAERVGVASTGALLAAAALWYALVLGLEALRARLP